MISPGLHGRGFTTEHNVELLSLSTYSLNYQLPVQTDTGNMQGGGSKPVYSNSVLLEGTSYHTKDKTLGSPSCFWTRVPGTDFVMASVPDPFSACSLMKDHGDLQLKIAHTQP